MRKGKVKCEILKAIRKEIAAANNIPFEPRLCRHQGDCLGTCPACEGEIRYLENKLSDMEASGRRPKLVGVSVGLASLLPVALGCTGNNQSGSKATDAIEQVIDTTQNVPADIPELTQKNDTAHLLDILSLELPIMGDEVDIDEADMEDVSDPPLLDETGIDLTTDMLVGEEVLEEEIIPYSLTQQCPQFNDGKFTKWICANVDKSKLQGMAQSSSQAGVLVSFIIEKDGSLTNAKVVKGVDEEADEEFVRVISSSPQWTPGMHNERPVRVSVTLNIKADQIDW